MNARGANLLLCFIFWFVSYNAYDTPVNYLTGHDLKHSSGQVLIQKHDNIRTRIKATNYC
jgi:hypothetical protein